MSQNDIISTQRKQRVALKVILSKLEDTEDFSGSEASSPADSPISKTPDSTFPYIPNVDKTERFSPLNRPSRQPKHTQLKQEVPVIMEPVEIVTKLLVNTTDLAVVEELVAENATYVSLNHSNPELQSIEPWCGEHLNAGPAAVHKTFVDVNRYWEVLAFDMEAAFGSGENVAVFGRFKYKSRTLGKITESPFCVWAKVDRSSGKVVYMQFMEDTLSTAASFRKSGKLVYASDPQGGEVVVGD